MENDVSISLGNHLDNFVENEVKSGRYESAKEVLKSALRLLESEDRKEKELIKALEVGEESGFVENFDPKKNLAALHFKHL